MRYYNTGHGPGIRRYFLLGLVLTLLACASSDEQVEEKIEFRPYYYPIEDLDTPKVYVFSDLPETGEYNTFFILKLVEDEGEKELHMVNFSRRGSVDYKVELITESGVFPDRRKKYKFYQPYYFHKNTNYEFLNYDSLGEFNCFDLKGQSYAWNLPAIVSSSYSVKFNTGPHPVIPTKQFLKSEAISTSLRDQGTDTIFGEVYNTIILQDSVSFECYEIGYDPSPLYKPQGATRDYIVLKYWAEGIGLYKETGGAYKSIVLKEILTYDDFVVSYPYEASMIRVLGLHF